MAEATMVQTLMENLPAGANPYAFGLHFLEERRFPPVPGSTFKILIGFAVIHMCIISVSCAVIMVPLLYNQAKRRKYLWVTKMVYAGTVQVPFRVPNSLLAVAGSQLVSSILCLLYTCLDYVSFKSPDMASKVYLYAWVQLMWLFGFFGYWITGWAGLCTILCSPFPRIPRPFRPLLSRPDLVNLFSLLFPGAVAAGTFAWIASLVLAYHDESEAYHHLHAMVEVAAEQFDAKKAVNFMQLYKASAIYIQINRRLTQRLRWNSFCWAAVGLLTLGFFMLSGGSLVELLRRSQTKVKDMNPTRTRVKHSSDETFSQPGPAQIALELKRGYIYVLCHFSVMMVSMAYTIAVCLLIGIKADEVVLDSYWRSLGSWLYLVCGVIVAFALVLQSWRIFTDLDIIITESEATNTERGDLNETWTCGGESLCMDNLSIHDGKYSSDTPEVQIHQAVMGVRLQKAQVVVIRRAF
ncbi:hypothetical protein CROQUDRAFT_608660 [Cronartium quercuum f. sp. fusiforme G11]|uniref:Uncharacterized protein n=1 Tax=Cronartium quercuum f. sp. fusiforme G11 TaxID=708437 RepID=A0A9P6NET7_9BASI|nr:hypothetical protein CROQUDRAFT_608660 [Cronartium quercuum f. sp. fusiforme G11]